MSEDDIPLEAQFHHQKQRDVAEEIERGIQYLLQTRTKRFLRRGYALPEIVDGSAFGLVVGLCSFYTTSMVDVDRAREMAIRHVEKWFEVARDEREAMKREQPLP